MRRFRLGLETDLDRAAIALVADVLPLEAAVGPYRQFDIAGVDRQTTAHLDPVLVVRGQRKHLVRADTADEVCSWT